ncbi:MAG: PilZ domain-containing protein [Candidatus Omnitrophica bacterium]|nr:PilZ domain-containing protein [Candidatus Omnitrophota bacterium]
MRKQERRLNPRIDQKLPISVVTNGYDFVTSTHNISCLGAYCTIDKYVPPFTKVRIKLNLPIAQNGVKSNYDVDCTGVVVRSEDDPDGKFNVAIFFNEIKDQPRQKIAQYVKQFIG